MQHYTTQHTIHGEMEACMYMKAWDLKAGEDSPSGRRALRKATRKEALCY